MSEIETARLRMRPLTASDFDEHYTKITSDAAVMQTLLPEKALTIAEAQPWFNRFVQQWEHHQFGVWLLLEKETSNFIGHCGLRFLADIAKGIQVRT